MRPSSPIAQRRCRNISYFTGSICIAVLTSLLYFAKVGLCYRQRGHVNVTAPLRAAAVKSVIILFLVKPPWRRSTRRRAWELHESPAPAQSSETPTVQIILHHP